MRSFSEIRESPNFRRLKNSVEFKAELRTMLIVGCFCGVLILPAFLDQQDSAGRVLTILMLTGLILYQLYRVFRIFIHMESFTYTEAVLDRPHVGYRGAMYFTVRVRTAEGKELERDTNRIFGRAEPNFEDYVNQKVLIGYNNRTELVVVIQKLP